MKPKINGLARPWVHRLASGGLLANHSMRIVNQRDGCVIADKVEVAQSLAARLIGLMGRAGLPENSAFVISGCKQVHTFLMRFSIDVVFMDVESKVVRVVEYLRPWRITNHCRDAARAVELPAGAVLLRAMRVGDILKFEDVNE